MRVFINFYLSFYILEVECMLKYTYQRIVLDYNCIKTENFLELAKFQDTSFPD